MKVIVDRKRWLHGEGRDGFSVLYREEDGKMCCIGFACVEAGMTIDQITNVTTLAALPTDIKIPESLKPLISTKVSEPYNSTVAARLM